MFEVPYAGGTARIPNALIPGNEESNAPVEFDITPAWGPDMARLRSVLEASLSISGPSWDPATQDVVIKAFETGAGAFVNTVAGIRNLSIPKAMALRAGILVDPKGPADLKVPIVTGEQFGRICGDPHLLGITLYVAFEIMKLSKANRVDPRFFTQPSGSGSAGTRGRKRSTAGGARRTPAKHGTAGDQ
jgi:hypothetical protein